jgi:hypothetical protein
MVPAGLMAVVTGDVGSTDGAARNWRTKLSGRHPKDSTRQAPKRTAARVGRPCLLFLCYQSFARRFRPQVSAAEYLVTLQQVE